MNLTFQTINFKDGMQRCGSKPFKVVVFFFLIYMKFKVKVLCVFVKI